MNNEMKSPQAPDMTRVRRGLNEQAFLLRDELAEWLMNEMQADARFYLDMSLLDTVKRALNDLSEELIRQGWVSEAPYRIKEP